MWKKQTAATCDADYPTDGEAYTSLGVTLTNETDNGKYVCFWIKDHDGADPNITEAISQQVQGIDHTAPTIMVSNPDQAALGRSRTFTAAVTDAPAPPPGVTNNIDFRYKTITPANTGDTATCEDAAPSGASSYTSGDDIVFDDESDNNKWACFWATDTAGNVGKQHTDKVSNLDTSAPAIGITFQTYDFGTSTFTDTTRQDQTRNRLVKATATDASTVSMWSAVQTSSSCADSPFEQDGTTLRTGVTSYMGTYANMTFTGDAPVVVADSGGYVCFWAGDGATPPNIAQKASPRINNVVGAPVITITGPGSQTAIATSRTFRATDRFDGDSAWFWKRVDATGDCVAGIVNVEQYVEGEPVTFRSNDDNGKFLCFGVDDDSYPSRATTVKASDTAIANIEVTPITVEVTNPDQTQGAAERVFSAAATDDDQARATNWRWKIVDDDVVASAQYPCGVDPPSDARSYTPGDDVTVTRSTDNGKYVCFWTRDAIGNVGNAVSERIANIQPPTITITYTTTDATAHTASAVDDVAGRTTMRHQFLDAAANCAIPPPTGTRSYTEGRDMTLDDEAHNGKHLCFWTTDRDGDVGAASQAISGIDTDPVITVRGNGGRSQSTISAIDQQDASAWKIQLYDRDEEDAAYGLPPQDADGNLTACAALPPDSAHDYTEGATDQHRPRRHAQQRRRRVPELPAVGQRQEVDLLLDVRRRGHGRRAGDGTGARARSDTHAYSPPRHPRLLQPRHPRPHLSPPPPRSRRRQPRPSSPRAR